MLFERINNRVLEFSKTINKNNARIRMRLVPLIQDLFVQFHSKKYGDF